MEKLFFYIWINGTRILIMFKVEEERLKYIVQNDVKKLISYLET